MLLKNKNAVIYGGGGAIGGAVAGHATRAGITVDDWLAGLAGAGTLLKRLPTLAEVANFVAFVASDRAGAMTGAIVNLTCGSIVD